MTGIGDASLKITTTSRQAQAYFNQGLRLLHDFWFFEAYRAFREAARLDPSAGMAYWGMAQALSNFPLMGAQAAAAIQQAESLLSGLSPQEKHYVRAGAALILTPGDAGRDAYVQEMQSLIRDYPNDLNAPAFLAFFVMSGFDPDGRATPGEIYAQKLLRGILATHPENVAANHYWIHSVEGGPDPQSGLASVAVVLRGAPNAGHIVHMGGHIAYRLGDYEGARKYFLDSLKVDEAYLAREHIPAQFDDNYAHNLSYLAAACAEAGRKQEALDWAKKLAGLPAPPDYAGSALNYAIPAGSTLLRVHLRFENYAAAARDNIEFANPIDAAADDYQQGWRLYSHGMGLLNLVITDSGIADAEVDSDKLKSIVNSLNGLASQPPPMGGMNSMMAGVASFWTGGAARLLEIASLELQGELDRAKSESAQGFALLEEAIKKEHELGYTEPPYIARPAEELLGYAYLRKHAWELAREAFQQELHERPKSGFALFGIARSFEFQGRTSDAKKAYEEFLAAWQHADGDLPKVQAAEGWLRNAAAHGALAR